MAKLLYQGHGSLRLITDSGKVIYIDPFAGEGYAVPADLILVTHQHYDHNCIDLPAKNPGCRIWQSFDALKDGKYQTLTLDFAVVEAVEAYNHHHKKENKQSHPKSLRLCLSFFPADGRPLLEPKVADPHTGQGPARQTARQRQHHRRQLDKPPLSQQADCQRKQPQQKRVQRSRQKPQRDAPTLLTALQLGLQQVVCPG